MASPPIPPLLEHVGRRPFAFYPAILHVDHNQWLFRKATWQELVVVNARTGLELSIPRRFLGEVSSIDDPVLIVGLLRELEYRDGAVWPHRRRVLEMPVAVGAEGTSGPVAASGAAAPRHGPAPVVGIRLETRRSTRTFQLVGGAMAAAVFLGGVGVVREIAFRPRMALMKDRSVLELTAADGYEAVVRKLGAPSRERSALQDGTAYQALTYADRRYTIILRGGATLSDARYVGVVDAAWNPLHPVILPSGQSSVSLLRNLRRF